MRPPFLLLAATLLGAAAAPPDYVPDGGWRDNAWAIHFYERWFGRQLRAMHEPPLVAAADLKGFRRRIRLTVLPTFQPGAAYRIDERADGTMSLRWVRLDGKGGYAPGVIDRAEVRRLSAREVQAVSSAAAAADLARLPQETPLPDGDAIPICLDGTAFLFELLDAEGRHFVKRDCGSDEAGLARLAEILMALRPEVPKRRR